MRVTAGPASAIRNSCLGSSGIRSSRATPPIGKQNHIRGADPEMAGP